MAVNLLDDGIAKYLSMTFSEGVKSVFKNYYKLRVNRVYGSSNGVVYRNSIYPNLLFHYFKPKLKIGQSEEHPDSWRNVDLVCVEENGERHFIMRFLFVEIDDTEETIRYKGKSFSRKDVYWLFSKGRVDITVNGEVFEPEILHENHEKGEPVLFEIPQNIAEGIISCQTTTVKWHSSSSITLYKDDKDYFVPKEELPIVGCRYDIEGRETKEEWDFSEEFNVYTKSGWNKYYQNIIDGKVNKNIEDGDRFQNSNIVFKLLRIRGIANLIKKILIAAIALFILISPEKFIESIINLLIIPLEMIASLRI